MLILKNNVKGYNNLLGERAMICKNIRRGSSLYHIIHTIRLG